MLHLVLWQISDTFPKPLLHVIESIEFIPTISALLEPDHVTNTFPVCDVTRTQASFLFRDVVLSFTSHRNGKYGQLTIYSSGRETQEATIKSPGVLSLLKFADDFGLFVGGLFDNYTVSHPPGCRANLPRNLEFPIGTSSSRVLRCTFLFCFLSLACQGWMSWKVAE